MSKVLVTGGAGFIGSHLVDLLLQKGFEVRVLDDLSSGKLTNLSLDNPQLEFIKGSVENPEDVATACAKVDHVIHLAALVSVPISVEYPQRSAAINVYGFLNILNELRVQKFKGRLLFASSSAVYGDNSRDQPLRESDAPGHMISPYALDKYTNELYGKLYQEVYGVSTLGFRFFNVYGPRQDPSSHYSGVISIFMDKTSKGEGLCIHGDGEQVRDFVYVGDVAAILHNGLRDNYTGILNIGTGKATPINQLARLVQGLYGKPEEIERLDRRAGDVRYSCANTNELKHALGVSPAVPLGEGLAVLKDYLEKE